jgi:Ni,Fe-hydrogenase III small subunit/formate hydrogenlyase subunit 6/NADH:ubiquinone oxidoreductase subunit I
MLRILRARFRQGHRTLAYPHGAPPALPGRFRGHPVIDAARCKAGCRACADACPTQAIDLARGFALDLGKCLFCTACTEACPTEALRYGGDYRLAASARGDLVVGSGEHVKLAAALDAKLLKLFKRSLKLRVVSAGGCNGCESDVNVLSTIVWDIGRFGIQYVASPRHADGLLITGPVTANMKFALEETYAATPNPKIVIAVGACAIAGGPFFESADQHGGAAAVVPVDLFIPGCPPHPLTILDGLLRMLGRLEAERRVG